MPDDAASKIDARNLDCIFKARRVAVVGASPERGTARNTLVRVLQTCGYSGAIYPVNPRRDEIEGLTCYPDLSSVPEVPDVALVITPAATVPDIVRQCGEAGIPAAVVFSSGFEETEEGKAHAEALARAAADNDVVVLGPNCQGVWSVREKVLLTFSPAALAAGGLLHGPVAVISQSGALGGAIANYLLDNRIGLSYVVSVGNETQLDLLACLDWAVAQDDVRIVLLYIEGLKDGARLLPIAQRARERGVQIVALKAGNSGLGQSAIASHTGKIASPYAVYRHVFEQAGILAVDTLADLIWAAEALAFLPHPRDSRDPQGGVSVLSTSGGACALIADHSAQRGVPMTTFSPGTAKALDGLVPGFGRSANPVDLTGQIRADPMLIDKGLAAVAGDSRTEALIMQFSSGGRRDTNEKGDLFRSLARDSGMPVLLSFAGVQPEADQRIAFRDDGVFMCVEPSAAVRTLDMLYRRRKNFARQPPAKRPALAPAAAPAGWAHTMAALSACGIDAPGWRILSPTDRAAEACTGLTPPFAVKALPADAAHKTELGLVALDVTGPDEVDARARSFREILDDPDVGILVQEMVVGGIEVVLSCLRRTDFGPILTVGLGGIGIELFRDVAHLALPVDEGSVEEALARLKLWTLLQGYRGKPKADIGALTAAAVRFGGMFIGMHDVDEFEINPLIILPQGEGVCAVDALVTLKQEG